MNLSDHEAGEKLQQKARGDFSERSRVELSPQDAARRKESVQEKEKRKAQAKQSAGFAEHNISFSAKSEQNNRIGKPSGNAKTKQKKQGADQKASGQHGK